MTAGLPGSLPMLLAAALFLTPAGASAGRMMSMDPRITGAGHGPAAPGSVASIPVPRAFLERELLLTSTVIATDSPRVILGVSQVPVLVKPRVAGDVVELVRARAPIGGDETLAGAALATWPASASGDTVQLTPFSPVEVFTLDSTTYKAEHPTSAQDAVVEADRLAVTLHYDAAAVGKPAEGDPEKVQLAVRFTLFFRPAPAMAPRPYTEADAKTCGLFSVGTYESGVAGAPGDMAIRPDPGRKLRFVLHPTVPEMARAVVTRSLLTWNAALERVVGEKLVTVEVGTDATLMPGTPGVVVVYWFAGDIVEKFMGFTQALADPRNGEIIGGQILLSEQQLLGEGSLQALIDEAIVSATRAQTKASRISPRARALAAQVFTREPAPRAPGASMGGSPDDVLAWTVVHEAGHLLGLRHNFRASSDISRFPQGQHTTSCMDYLPTPLAPRAPLSYDEFALAFAQGVQPPVGAEGPFRFASDEALTSDPDCNQYDAGEPLAWARGYIQTLRAQRTTLAEAASPDVSAGLMFTCLGGAAKLAVNPGDPRHAEALRFLLALLSDSGADPAIGGGLSGTTTGETPAELARAKNLPDRRAATAHFVQLAASGRLPATERDLFLRTLARTAFDQSRTDLFEARRFALSTLSKLEGADARLALWTMLSALQRQLVSGKRTPTYDQDLKIFEKGRKFLSEAVK